MGMERGIAHFLSPTCMTQAAFMDIIPNSINGAFQGNDTSQSFHSGQSYSLFASPKPLCALSMIGLSGKQVTVSCGIITLLHKVDRRETSLMCHRF